MTSTAYVNNLSTFFANGGKLDVTIVGGTVDKSAATTNLSFLKSHIGVSNCVSIEGSNEYNQSGSGTWPAELADFTKWLWNTVRADSAFDPLLVIAPAMWSKQGYSQLVTAMGAGACSPYVDRGCIHYYSGQNEPTRYGSLSGGGSTTTMDHALSDARTLVPSGEAMWMTETGWQAPAGNIPITNRACSKYVLRDYFDAYARGVEFINMYQLIDDQTNLFGLCDANANPKPQYNSLKNLVALFKDSGNGTGSINPTVSGAPLDMVQYLFRKANGTALLVMYRDVLSWNNGDIDPTPINVTVNFGQSVSTVEVYEPTFTAPAISTANNVTSKSVAVADHVVVVKITP